MSTSSTSITNEEKIEQISNAASRFEKEHGPINHVNVVDATHTIAQWITMKPSEVRQVLEKMCKLSSILDEGNDKAI